MKAFSVPGGTVGADSPRLTVSCQAVGNCPQGTEISVGQSRHDHIRAAEEDLDDLIDELKTLAALAEESGRIHTAYEYTRRMLAASASRTPEHKDRLAREHLAAVEASLDRGVDFFQVEGRRAAAQRTPT